MIVLRRGLGLFDELESMALDFGAFVATGTSDGPTARGPKTVAPDVYEGPDIDSGTGAYDPSTYEGPDVNPETGVFVPAKSTAAVGRAKSPAPSAAPAAASSLPSWVLPVGLFAVLAVGAVVIGRRKK